jgi:hypothetical protein
MTEPLSPTSRALSQHEIDTRVKPLLDEMIRYNEDSFRPFRRTDWVIVLVARELTAVDDDILQALNETISEAPPATALGVPVELLALEDVVEFTKSELPVCDDEGLLTFKSPEIFRIRHFDYALFDASKRWAVINYHDDCTMVGGDAEFMNAFAARVDGGFDALKRRFIEYVDEWYPSVEFRKKVLAGVGWKDAWQPKE